MLRSISNFLRDEEGASAVEYGLIVGLIAVALIFILFTLGGDLGDLFTSISDGISNPAGAGGGGTTGG